jgi:DnaK suppressor protein
MVREERFVGIRKRLEDERASLRDQIESLVADNQGQQDDYGVGNHLADDATEVFTRERNIALRHNAEDLLAQVEAALHRLSQGVYGICARCSREIATERLEALPSATLCITCQAEVERGR